MNKIREGSSQRRQGIRVCASLRRGVSLSNSGRLLNRIRASVLFNASISDGAYLLDCRSPESRGKLPTE